MSIDWNRDKILESIEYTDNFREDLVKFISEIVNEYNGLSFDVKFYDIILGDFVNRLNHQVFSLFIDDEIFENSKNYFDVKIFSTSRSFKKHYHIDKNSKLLHKLIFNLKHGNKIKLSLFNDDLNNRKKIFKINNLLKGFLFNNKSEIKFFENPFNYDGLIRQTLSWRDAIGYINQDFEFNLPHNLNSKWRLSKFMEISNNGNFFDILKKITLLTLPLELLENFKYLNDFFLNKNDKFPKILLSSRGLHSNIKYKILAANWKKLGTKILYLQHGGEYGVTYRSIHEEYEINCSSNYYSWGWTDKSAKVKPLVVPRPRLKKIVKKKILFIPTNWPESVTHLRFVPIGEKRTDEFRNDSFSFLKSLKIREEIVLRPYIHDYKEFKKNLFLSGENICIDKSKNSLQSFNESKIVIHNSLQTTWLETLSLNIPTICFYNPEVYLFRSGVNEIIDKLKEVGILHTSPISAAKFLNDCYKNPDEWWASQNLQKVVNNFVKNYANLSENWKDEWMTELKSNLR